MHGIWILINSRSSHCGELDLTFVPRGARGSIQNAETKNLDLYEFMTTFPG